MIESNNDEVICPNCVTQFRAIPVNVQTEIADLKETIAQQAEAIRMKDAVLNRIMLNGWGLWALTDIAEALSIQPSPEILQARDERVAEACAKYVYAMGGAKGSVLLAEMMLSGEWRKYL